MLGYCDLGERRRGVVAQTEERDARSSGERRRGVVAQTEERDARSSGERRRGVVAQTEERDARSSGERRRGVVAQTEERDARSSGERRRGVVAETEESGKETAAESSAIASASFHAIVQRSPAGVVSWTTACVLCRTWISGAVQQGKRRNSLLSHLRERKMTPAIAHTCPMSMRIDEHVTCCHGNARKRFNLIGQSHPLFNPDGRDKIHQMPKI